MSRRQIAVLGAGNVGREVAFWIAIRELGDIVLWNRTAETAIGNALDLAEAGPAAGFEVSVKGTGNISDIRGSDIVVVTAGAPRKEGQTREELVATNASIVRSLAVQIKKYAPKSIVIVVTNPLDAMTYLTLKATGFPKNRVVGMAGILDTSRFKYFISGALGISHKKVSAMVLGSHGEGMVPALSRAKVGGKPLAKALSAKQLEKVVAKAKRAGAEIIRLLNANASFAVGASVAVMLDAIVKNRKSIHPCSAYLGGEYGIRDVCIGVPVRLGKRGAEKVVQLKLDKGELAAIRSAAKKTRKLNALALVAS